LTSSRASVYYKISYQVDNRVDLIKKDTVNALKTIKDQINLETEKKTESLRKEADKLIQHLEKLEKSNEAYLNAEQPEIEDFNNMSSTAQLKSVGKVKKVHEKLKKFQEELNLVKREVFSHFSSDDLDLETTKKIGTLNEQNSLEKKTPNAVRSLICLSIFTPILICTLLNDYRLTFCILGMAMVSFVLETSLKRETRALFSILGFFILSFPNDYMTTFRLLSSAFSYTILIICTIIACFVLETLGLYCFTNNSLSTIIRKVFSYNSFTRFFIYTFFLSYAGSFKR